MNGNVILVMHEDTIARLLNDGGVQVPDPRFPAIEETEPAQKTVEPEPIAEETKPAQTVSNTAHEAEKAIVSRKSRKPRHSDLKEPEHATFDNA